MNWWENKITKPQPISGEDLFKTDLEKEAYRKGYEDGIDDGYESVYGNEHIDEEDI